MVPMLDEREWPRECDHNLFWVEAPDRNTVRPVFGARHESKKFRCELNQTHTNSHTHITTQCLLRPGMRVVYFSNRCRNTLYSLTRFVHHIVRECHPDTPRIRSGFNQLASDRASGRSPYLWHCSRPPLWRHALLPRSDRSAAVPTATATKRSAGVSPRS